MRFPRQLRLVLTTKSLRFGAYFLRASLRRGRYLAPLIAQNIAASRAICAPRNRPCRATPQIWSSARLRGQPLDPVRYKIAFRVERRVRWNDSNRGVLARQGRLRWLRNLIQPRSTSILKIPRKRPRPTARWTEILWPVWLAHFRRQTRSAALPRQPPSHHCASGGRADARPWRPQHRFRIGHVAARSKRARRNVALHFWSQRHVLSTQWNFLGAGRAFDRDQRMLELWNNWYETLASSAEALAIVIVIVAVAAGVTTLAESRRR